MQHLSSIGKSAPLDKGWRIIAPAPQEKHYGHTDLSPSQSLINLIHISDTHICDAQSPARVEYLDRYADPHHPVSQLIGSLVGTYRAHEFLTVQVLESMIQSINSIETAPITKIPITSVVITGDMTDNAQINEMNWFTTLLEGGKVTPDSGAHSQWEGVGGKHYSPHFWNPHGTPTGEEDDFPRKLYGFPVIPEILDAARATFVATGLKHPWLAVHGNHDALLQGTVVPDELLRSLAVSSEKIMELSDHEAIAALQQVSEIGPAKYPAPAAPVTTAATADPSRDFVQPHMWGAYILNSKSTDFESKKYWRRDFEKVTILALDTVNPYGGWQGSIDQEQFEWLKSNVESLHDRYLIITSHHPVEDIFNSYTPHEQPRVLGIEIEAYLISQPHVITWICGHTHRNRIRYHGPDKTRGFWQIETSSLIDWPQEGRIIEIFLDHNQDICIASTQINHNGVIASDVTEYSVDQINDLAGISRLLSVNDWQRREGNFAIESNEGNAPDRSSLLRLPKRI
jgi:metallophosphoesterase (TIGR03767 family)